MALSYSTFVTQLSNELVIDPADANFLIALPNIIDYAEQRIYRELDLLSTVVRVDGTLSVNTRTFNLPTSGGRFVTVQGVNVITPSGEISSSGTRVPLKPVNRSLIDFLYPSDIPASSVVPEMFAMITDQQIIVGSPPSVAYVVEIVGTIRPTPLSAANTTTYLTLYLPDMFFAASMVSGCAYIKNFGTQSDNPAQAQSWEAQYKGLFASANTEEIRKRYNQAIEAKMRES